MIPWEGSFPQCKRCRMQCNPQCPRHIHLQVCQQGVERRTQMDSAIKAALALRQLFYVEGEVLEKVELFRYLGRILAQDNEDVRAVRSQIKKARGTWARVGQVLQADNAPPKVSAILQGGCPVGAPLRQQELKPHEDCTGVVGGVPHQGWLLDG